MSIVRPVAKCGHSLFSFEKVQFFTTPNSQVYSIWGETIFWTEYVCLFIDPWGTRPSPSWRPVFLTFWAYALNGLSLFRHEYCNFTCMVSYHLDFHQLDLGSFTGLQYCWHPVFNEPKLDTSIYSLMWRTRTTWRHNLHARDNAPSILSGSPIAVDCAVMPHTSHSYETINRGAGCQQFCRPVKEPKSSWWKSRW